MGKLVTVMVSGSAFFICVSHRKPVVGVGATYITGSSNVFVSGLPVTRTLDVHADFCGHPSIAIQGSSTVFVNGRPVHRILDLTSKGFCTIPGQGTVFAGG